VGMSIRGVREALVQSGIDVRDADRLLAHVTGEALAWLRAHDDASLEDTLAVRVRDLAARRAQGEPLAYVLGTAGFYGREFAVDARVLIPRPETEHLVDAALEHLRGRVAARALDVGTGSGAIACTLAAELPAMRIDAVDISPDALAVAIGNRDRLGLSAHVTFHLGDLLEPVAHRRFHAIVANLPYVPTGQGDAELRYEPALALDGGPDGLDLYRRFFARAPMSVAPGGLLLAEGAPPIAPGLLALAREAFPHARVTSGRDYGGRERYVKVETQP
jgi:release factor glutamine methyltransferase